MVQKELDKEKKNISKEKVATGAIIDESDVHNDHRTKAHKKIDQKFQQAIRKITRTS